MWSSTKAHSTKFVSAHHSLGIFTYLTSPDLIIVKILTFLMPTNALTSCLLLVSLLGGFVAAYVKVLPIVLVMEASTTLDLNAAKPLLEKVRNTLNPNTHCRGRPLFAAPQRPLPNDDGSPLCRVCEERRLQHVLPGTSSLRPASCSCLSPHAPDERARRASLRSVDIGTLKGESPRRM